MSRVSTSKLFTTLHINLLALLIGLSSIAAAEEPFKVFILAGDEYVLEHGLADKEGAPGTLVSVSANDPKYAFLRDKDGQSDAKSAVYEKHLAALIRDLRKDLKQPDLPVVVTAMANAKRNMPPNEERVFDAQMAVGDPEKYPEFDGNVISIDTRPMCRPIDESPGGRDRYNGNAASYLEIGDAIAEAMLKLMSTRTNGED